MGVSQTAAEFDVAYCRLRGALCGRDVPDDAQQTDSSSGNWCSSDEIRDDMYNYGQLQVVFEDGSVGWYEAGWGPMMSEVAFFVKDVVGPKGCVSIVEPEGAKKAGSADISAHTKTNCLRKHISELDSNGNFAKQDVLIDTSDEPDHQELCNREQAYFLKSIQEDIDLSEHMEDAINSLRIVLAADKSVRTGQVVNL